MGNKNMVPIGFLDGLKEEQVDKNKEAIIAISGTEEQKYLLLEELASRITSRLEDNK